MKETHKKSISNIEKEHLNMILKYEVARSICEQVKVILLLDKGKNYEDISEFLFIDINKVYEYAESYKIQGIKGILNLKYKVLPQDVSILYSDISIEQLEAKALEKNFPEIKDHIDYLDSIYNLCFKTQQMLHDKKIKEISDLLRAQMMILMRITDFLRSMFHLIIKGYPEQAGTLAASIFELAHTALSFSKYPNAVTEWLKSDSIHDEMPKLLKIALEGKNFVQYYPQLIKKNYENAGHLEHYKKEYRIYKQLCWMKHSLPKMQDIIIRAGNAEFQVGPYTNERSINHAWFSIEHGGRLAEFVIDCVLKSGEGDDSLLNELQETGKIRENLNKKALERFGSDDPFE